MYVCSQTHVHAFCYRACKDAPLRSTTKLVYIWQVEGAEPMEHRTLACKMLHCVGKSNVPRPLKVPLLCSILPHAIEERRLVPAMHQYNREQIHCHGLAVALDHEGTYDTTILNVRGKRVEHLKLAQISGNRWLVHPGTLLTPSEIFPTTIV